MDISSGVSDSYLAKQSMINNLKNNLGTGNQIVDLIIGIMICGFINSIFQMITKDNLIYYMKIIKDFLWPKKIIKDDNRKKYIMTIRYSAIYSEKSQWSVLRSTYGDNNLLIDCIAIYLLENPSMCRYGVDENDHNIEVKYDEEYCRTSCNQKTKSSIDQELNYVDKTSIFLNEPYKGVKIVYLDDEQTATQDNNKIQQKNRKMEISSYDKNKITLFLDECKEYRKKLYFRKINNLYNNEQPEIYFIYKKTFGYDEYETKHIVIDPKKTFNDIFFKNKEKMIRDISSFQEDKSNYSKLSFLFYGPPGTGKTSIVKCISNMTSRHIQYIKLSQYNSFDDLVTDMFSPSITIPGKPGYLDNYIKIDSNKKIIVFEDIDAENDIILKRQTLDELNQKKIQEKAKAKAKKLKEKKRKEKLKSLEKDAVTSLSDSDDSESDSDDSDKSKNNPPKLTSYFNRSLNLSDVLQVFDGFIEQKGLIICMTTNHINKLDPALIRAGRVTHKIHLAELETSDMIDMIKYHFPNDNVTNKTLCYRNKSIVPCEIERLIYESNNYQHFCQLLKEYYKSK